MKTRLLMVLLAAVILVPALAAQEVAPAVSPQADTAAAPNESAQVTLDDLFTAPLFQAEIGATAFCTTQCPGGETISCITSDCRPVPYCGVFCQGRLYRCISGCI